MSNAYEIRNSVPIPDGRNNGRGLSATIRRMVYGDSIVISSGQLTSVYTCARSVGAKVKTSSNKDGTLTVWRIDRDASHQPQPSLRAQDRDRDDPRPFSYAELRYFFDNYVASHSIEQAVEILKSFGCNRITEAAALDPARMNELVDSIAGPGWSRPGANLTPASAPFKPAFPISSGDIFL